MRKEITVVIDTREQLPLDLAKHGLVVEVGTLAHGDYSLIYPDLRRHVAIERKTLGDFIACCGSERGRFEKELWALRGYRWKAVVIEARLADVLAHNYRSKITPKAVTASVARWMLEGIPFIFADNADGASSMVANLLQLAAKDTLDFAKVADRLEQQP